MTEVNQDNATEGQEITGVKVMKLKTFMCNYSCMVNDINIVLIDCKSDYTETRINIRNRKDFCDFIDTYGNSIVNEWMVSNGCGTPWIRFYLQNLVNEVKKTVKPTTKLELARIIEDTLEKEGYKCDLNFIDTSLITDMSHVFDGSQFKGDISKWDVSNVENMSYMFYASDFNGNIADWDVSKVEDMRGMFGFSIFDKDISKWEVSNVRNMSYMFCESEFNGNIADWDVSNVTNMLAMFAVSQFNGNIADWDIKNVTNRRFMFENCPLEKNPPEWY